LVALLMSSADAASSLPLVLNALLSIFGPRPFAAIVCYQPDIVQSGVFPSLTHIVCLPLTFRSGSFHRGFRSDSLDTYFNEFFDVGAYRYVLFSKYVAARSHLHLLLVIRDAHGE